MTTTLAPVRSLVSRFVDGVHRQQAARAALRSLEADLASYRSQRDIDDLLELLAHQDSADAELIRRIVLDQRPEPELKFAA